MNAPDTPSAIHRDAFESARAWFAAQGWNTFAFQEEVWAAHAAGESGLIHAPTGMGKTYAALMGPLACAPASGADANAPALTLLWITPLRALASDTTLAIRRAATALQPQWTVDLRTGDTPASVRARQDRRLPTILVTTPESLTLLLSRADWRERLAHLETVVVDEWHELLASKRGVQVELALARLRGARPALRAWGLSATLANLDQALQCLVGMSPRMPTRIVRGLEAKTIEIATAHPPTIERFPWAGHIGTRLVPEVVRAIDRARTTLVFTNVRSAAEIWYQALLEARPDWAGQIALHHGSLDRGVREWVEQAIRDRKLRAVVCTSSLDLGVDFAPVDQVLQIGSPKGVARLLQRAGRSGHRPGEVSKVTVVPAQALELVEAAAARAAAAERRIEPRVPVELSLDVLVQHLVTCALGGGFVPAELLRGAARHARVSRARFHAMAVGAGFRRAWRREPERVSRVPPRGHRRRRSRHRPRSPHRAAAPPVDRHHRVGREHPRAVSQRAKARPCRGVVHRPPEQGRLLRVRRPACSSSCACAR